MNKQGLKQEQSHQNFNNSAVMDTMGRMSATGMPGQKKQTTIN